MSAPPIVNLPAPLKNNIALLAIPGTLIDQVGNSADQ